MAADVHVTALHRKLPMDLSSGRVAPDPRDNNRTVKFIEHFCWQVKKGYTCVTYSWSEDRPSGSRAAPKVHFAYESSQAKAVARQSAASLFATWPN